MEQLKGKISDSAASKKSGQDHNREISKLFSLAELGRAGHGQATAYIQWKVGASGRGGQGTAVARSSLGDGHWGTIPSRVLYLYLTSALLEPSKPPV